jgi:hypothetical protein
MAKRRFPVLDLAKLTKRRSLFIALCLLMFFLLFFWDALAGRHFLLIYDPFSYSYPLRTIAWESIRAGTLPTWTPLILSGYPLLSMAQLGLGYPLTWGYLFLPGHWAEQLYILAPFLLASVFTYIYARAIKRTRVAALLAGLSFAYGGMMAGGLSNGLLPNAVMWLPLLLTVIEKARRSSLLHCWSAATVFYALSVLTGIGQGFLYVGILALAYAFWLGLFCAEAQQKTFQRWRPLLAAGGMLAGALGLAAFQILETAQAVRLSVREKLSYEFFSSLAFAPRVAFKTLLAPPYHAQESTPYLTLVTLLLAAVAAVLAIITLPRRKRRNARQLFWVLVGVLSWLLMLGDHTPLYKLLFQIPVVNMFRGASRHSFEWTFALSILAAYGWDAVTVRLRRLEGAGRSTRKLFITPLMLMLSLCLGVAWWHWAKDKFGRLDTETTYLAWKFTFTAVLLSALWLVGRLTAAPIKRRLALATVLLSCFVEPYILYSRWWGQINNIPASRLKTVPEASRWLRQFRPEENRVYVRASLFSEQSAANPRLDPPNLTMLRGLHNLAGYEPLQLERYHRALGYVWLDGVTAPAGMELANDVWGQRSHVLDLLNTTFVASYANGGTWPVELFKRSGIGFSTADLGLTLETTAAAALVPAGPAAGDQLILVTTLTNAGAVEQGAIVAELRVWADDGSVVERTLRAGLDTAEWAYERTDVRQAIKHAQAPVFERLPGDAAQSFFACRYLARIPLGQRLRVRRIELRKVRPESGLLVFKASCYDAATGVSQPFLVEHKLPFTEPAAKSRWEVVQDRDRVLIVRNHRALPRAWLVPQVTQVTAEEALRRIQGTAATAFDPRREALLETEQLPNLSGEALLPNEGASITSYEPNRLVLETKAERPRFLVISEISYPGWVATIDQQPATIFTTDYLLRGLSVPAGQHQVELRYQAPGTRKGALISLLTLLLLCIAWWRGKINNEAQATISTNEGSNAHKH